MARPIGRTPGSCAIAPGFTGRGIEMNGGRRANIGHGRINAYGRRAGVSQGRINAYGRRAGVSQGRMNAPPTGVTVARRRGGINAALVSADIRYGKMGFWQRVMGLAGR